MVAIQGMELADGSSWLSDAWEWIWDALTVLGTVWFAVVFLLLLGAGAVVAGQSLLRWKRERSGDAGR